MIENATKPAADLNLCDKTKCLFVSGSWEALAASTAHTFDVVLMSETLYNTSYYPSLVSLLDKVTGADSLIIIGTKTFYYGLGGGFFQFQLHLKGSPFVLETHAKFNDMKSIERMILLMKRGQSETSMQEEPEFQLTF